MHDWKHHYFGMWWHSIGYMYEHSWNNLVETDFKGSPNREEHHYLIEPHYLKREATSQICLADWPKEMIISLSKQLKNVSLSEKYYF